MAYCTVDDVRDITGIGSSTISNTVGSTLINKSCVELNNLLNVRHRPEKVDYIDSWRDNDIDDENTVFFTQDYPIGDKDDNFSIGTSDIVAYTIDSDGNRTEYSISSVEDDIGKVTLGSAPAASEDLYFEYDSIPVEISDKLVDEAATFLSAHYWLMRSKGRGFKKYSLGSLKIEKGDDNQISQPFKGEAFQRIEEIRNEKISVKRAKKWIQHGEEYKDSPRVV